MRNEFGLVARLRQAKVGSSGLLIGIAKARIGAMTLKLPRNQRRYPTLLLAMTVAIAGTFATTGGVAAAALTAPAAVPSSAITGVISRDGVPIAGATVLIRAYPSQTARAKSKAGVPLDMPIVASVTTDSTGSFAATPVGVPAQDLDPSGIANFEAFVSDGSVALPWNFPLQMTTVGGVVKPDLGAPMTVSSGSHRAVDLRLDLGSSTPGGADAYDPPTAWQGIQPGQLTPSGLLRGSTGSLVTAASLSKSAGVSPMLGCGILVPQNNWKYGINEAFANVWSWTGAKVEFKEATSSTHTLGLALQGSGGGWSQNGSMSYTETGGSTADVSGLYDNQVYNRVDYEDNLITCVLLHEWAPGGTYALMYPILGWPHSSHPIWGSCAVYGNGAVMTKTQGTNSTINGGVGFGPISLSAQAGWNTSIDEAFHFTQTSYLCGSTGAGWVSSPEAEAHQ